MRFIAALLLGAMSLVSFRGLRAQSAGRFNTSLCFAVLLALVPSAQVIAGWAIGWPYAATALLAIGGFFTVEGALAAGSACRRRARSGAMGGGAGPDGGERTDLSAERHVLLVPLAGALIAQRRRTLVQSARWVAIHLGFVAGTLGIGLWRHVAAVRDGHVFVKSGRIAFEAHWGEKIAWFLQEPLPNALSLFVLNDNNHRDQVLYLGCAAMVGAILIAGACLEWRRYGRQRGIIWLGGIARSARVCFRREHDRIGTLRHVPHHFGDDRRAAVLPGGLGQRADRAWSVNARRKVTAVFVFSIAFFTAQHHLYALIAVPQGNEWQLIVAGAKHVRLDGARPRIFAIASSPADISTATIYHDEFGSLSSNSEWVPREMFKRAMHDLHPEIANLDSRYDFATGPELPEGQRYDVIIDMHRLRQFYVNN